MKNFVNYHFVTTPNIQEQRILLLKQKMDPAECNSASIWPILGDKGKIYNF